jgi:hypothetical protein
MNALRIINKRGKNGFITELTPRQYEILEDHLRAGYSFWSAHGKLGISMGILQRMNKFDDRTLTIRHKFDQGRRLL